MGILRKANTETKTVYLDESDYIVVRADISKREFNALVARMPNVNTDGEASLTIGEASAFSRVLFETLVVGWSLSEGQPTVEDYDSLAAEGANVLDTKLAEHFETLLPTSAEGK